MSYPGDYIFSYVPADLIASYLLKPHPGGGFIQSSELPISLPGYLIRLKPRIHPP